MDYINDNYCDDGKRDGHSLVAARPWVVFVSLRHIPNAKATQVTSAEVHGLW